MLRRKINILISATMVFVIKANCQVLVPDELYYDMVSRLGVDEKAMIDTLFTSPEERDAALSFALFQNRMGRFRDDGMNFWRKFPASNRKFEWFLQTMDIAGAYLYWRDEVAAFKKYGYTYRTSEIDVPLNWIKLIEWETILPELKRSFRSYIDTFSNQETAKSYYYRVLFGEFWQFLALSRNVEYRKVKSNGKFDINRFYQFLDTSIQILNEHKWPLSYFRRSVLNLLDNDFLAIYMQYGITDAELSQIFDRLSNNDSYEIKRWAEQRKSLLALKEIPFRFKHTDVKGDIIDFDNFRGKIVLFDFWSTYCTSCVARMPYLKKMYDKYKDRGFVMISVCVNPIADSIEIKKIEKKIDADWQFAIIGGKNKEDHKESLARRIWRQYGFSGVPQLLLFDRSGKLLKLNDELRNSDFEEYLVKLLADR